MSEGWTVRIPPISGDGVKPLVSGLATGEGCRCANGLLMSVCGVSVRETKITVCSDLERHGVGLSPSRLSSTA